MFRKRRIGNMGAASGFCKVVLFSIWDEEEIWHLKVSMWCGDCQEKFVTNKSTQKSKNRLFFSPFFRDKLKS